jgi:hypothetical protein
MRNPRLPNTFGGFDISDDGVLSRGDFNVFPWFTKDGYIGGTVRYRLIAEEVSQEELFMTQDKTQ